jgi:hypothetical protein
MGHRTRKGAVLYIALEGCSGFAARLKAAEKKHGDPGPLFARLKNPVRLGRAPGAEADVARIIAAAKQLARQAGFPVVLIVIDTLHRALAGDNENEAAAISAVVDQANRIAAETGAAVMFAHHPGKDIERGMRGSSAMAADVDVVIRIERESGSPTRNVILEKAKDGEEGALSSFTLERVVLGRDNDGDEIASCVVGLCDCEGAGRLKPIKQGSVAGKALNELQQLVLDDQGEIAEGHARAPDGVRLISLSTWRETCRRKRLSTGDLERENRAFLRAVDALTDAGRIGEFDGAVWLLGGQHRSMGGQHE